MTSELAAIIESLLFAADEPLSIEALRGALQTADATAVRHALEELAAEYEGRGGGFHLRHVAGGYQLRTRPQFHPWIQRLRGTGADRLSKAALETLAIVAYRQPIIRAEIETLRGVDCGGVLRVLLERRLVRVLGRREIPGRPLIYGTTKLFLEVFELRDLKDLPTLKEIQDLAAHRLPEDDPDAPAVSSPVPDASDDGKNP